MVRLKSVKRKLILTLFFSIFMSVGAIIHGAFFDLDFSQLNRFSFGGLFLTFSVFFPSLLFIEWVFDLEDKEEFKLLEGRVGRIEKKLGK